MEAYPQLERIQVVEPAAHTSCFVFHVVTMDLDTSIICIVNFVTMWSLAMLCDRVHEVASETRKIWTDGLHVGTCPCFAVFISPTS